MVQASFRASSVASDNGGRIDTCESTKAHGAEANVHHYRQLGIELREQLLHQETANKNLMLDIEKQTQQIYELRDQLQAAQNELSSKDRECYNLHKELSEA